MGLHKDAIAFSANLPHNISNSQLYQPQSFLVTKKIKPQSFFGRKTTNFQIYLDMIFINKCHYDLIKACHFKDFSSKFGSRRWSTIKKIPFSMEE